MHYLPNLDFNLKSEIRIGKRVKVKRKLNVLKGIYLAN